MESCRFDAYSTQDDSGQRTTTQIGKSLSVPLALLEPWTITTVPYSVMPTKRQSSSDLGKPTPPLAENEIK
ncbi:glycosyltransferase family 31 protein [Moniliophthora roreri]|nr:glycosyltransferase family 31 protein [Moniliophthora roreri]